jgi:C-terminal processing protease CtpA/Prc
MRSKNQKKMKIKSNQDKTYIEPAAINVQDVVGSVGGAQLSGVTTYSVLRRTAKRLRTPKNLGAA